jgi:hypothetical protein
MKAEHRRELNTNALADRMGRLVQGMKETPQGGSAVIWIVGIVAVVTLVTWFFASGATSWSQYWIQLDTAKEPADFAKIAEASQGTMPARAARFQVARLQLRDGLRNMYAPERRTLAIQSIEEARRAFTELAAECKGDPLLVQEALLGAAQAEEALIGVPLKDDPAKSSGNLDRVLELYHEIADGYPASYFAQVADKRLHELENDKAAVESFYNNLSKVAEAKKERNPALAPPAD